MSLYTRIPNFITFEFLQFSKGSEDSGVKPKYEEMAYEDRWRSRKDRKLNDKPEIREDDNEEAEGGGDGEDDGQVSIL
jgi:hypothetical protein